MAPQEKVSTTEGTSSSAKSSVTFSGVANPMDDLESGDFMTASERREKQLAEFEGLPWPLNCFNGLSTTEAKITTALGCLSSCIVLAVRLYLDHKSTTYLIHSIIVWTDMVLIHLFTRTRWLSISGELTTYLFFLSYHFTHEVVFELLETTVLAILCSFHLMNSRKQIGEERDMLNEDIDSLRRRGALLLRNIDQVHRQLAKKEKESEREQTLRQKAFLSSDTDLLHGESVAFDDKDGDTASETETMTTSTGGLAEDTELTRELLKSGECNCSLRTFGSRLNEWLRPFNSHEPAKCNRFKCYREIFFEYFLDGAAGVMYTSFLGLIIDALLKWGSNDAY